MRHHRVAAFFSMGLLTLGSGCSTSDDTPDAVGHAIITSFDANPVAIDPGMSAFLRWEVSGATRLGLETEEGAAIVLGQAELEAQQIEVRPAQTTRYVLSARGKDGQTVTREARVSVRTDTLRILEFKATPGAAGKGSRLSWATENATAVRIFTQEGAEIPLGDASPAEGSIAVEPARSTTYTLRASNATAVEEAKVSVTVQAALDAELFTDRQRIDSGEETILRWRTRSATRIVIRTVGEILADSTTELSGSLSIAPRTTTTYEVTAHGDDGTAVATTQVKVAPVIEAFAAATPGPLARGAEVELRFSIRGAEAVRLSNTDGWTFDAEGEDLSEGSVIAAVPADGTFLLEASLGAEKVVRSLQIPILEAPAVLAYAVSPDVVTLADGGSAEVTFSWTTARASSVEIAEEGGAIVVSVADGAASGTAKVQVDQGAVFVLTARNEAGAASSSAEVRAFAPPSIESFVAWPSHAGVGEAFLLSWETTAASVAIESDGLIIHSGQGGAGSLTRQIAATSTFRLLATNEAGETVERELSVTVGQPSILSFTADRTRHGPGSSVRFSWVTLGGTSLSLIGPGGVVCATADRETIPAGDCTVLLPSTPGQLSYTLTLANGLAETDVASQDLEVADGPAIFEFYPASNRLTLGDSVTFHWSTGVDGENQAPTLELADGADVYPLGAADPLSGSATITPLQVGARTFRLTASTQGTTAAVREVLLQVHEAPTLSVAVGSPSTYEPGMGPVEITWQSTKAVELEVFEVDQSGASTSIAVYVDPVLVASGALDVVPPAPGRTYRFVAMNAANGAVIREVDVNWALPDIVGFSASPEDIVLHTSTQIQWITAGASSVAIEPEPLVETEPFVDLRESQTASELVLMNCGAAQLPTDGCATVTFPFGFPYGGQMHNQARVYQNGVISFDMSYQGGSTSVAELPQAQASFVALAPFWQPMRASVPGSTRVGQIFFEEGTDANGSHVVIQWAGFWASAASAAQPVHLDFEVVVYESGDFDFRYGRMEGANLAEWVDGRHASIGYQSLGGAEGRSVSFQQATDGGLDGLSFGVRQGVLPMIGSIQALPLSFGTTGYVLTATNDAGSTTAAASVTAHAPVVLEDVYVVEAFPLPNTSFTIGWTTTAAKEVRVELPQADPEDEIVVLCTVLAAQPQVCVLQEAAVGTYSYVVRALGHGELDETTANLDVEIFPPFSVDSFFATPAVVAPGDEVTLTWTTTNATSISLTANGVSVNVSALSPLGDSVAVEVEVSTTFVLTATSHGRVLSQTRSITVEEPPPASED